MKEKFVVLVFIDRHMNGVKESEKIYYLIYNYFNTVVVSTNAAAMNQTGTGQMSLLSNDVIRFDQLTMYLNYIWIMPFMVILYLVKVFVSIPQ